MRIQSLHRPIFFLNLPSKSSWLGGRPGRGPGILLRVQCMGFVYDELQGNTIEGTQYKILRIIQANKYNRTVTENTQYIGRKKRKNTTHPSLPTSHERT